MIGFRMPDRDWGQYHTVPNIAKSIAIEAAELLKCNSSEEVVCTGLEPATPSM